MREESTGKKPPLIKSMVNSILEKGLSAEPHPVQLRIRERTGLPLTRPTGLREFLKGSVRVEPTLIGDGEKVMLYPSCMVLYRFPEYEASALKLLLELGFSIVYPSTITCCGSTLLESYDTKTWVLAGAVIHAIAQELGAQCIVTLCGTCTSTLHIVRELLNENTEIREWVNEVLEKNNLKYHGGVAVKHVLEVILEKRNKLPEPRELCASREDVDVVLQLPCNITSANGVIRGSEVLGVLREWLSALSPSPASVKVEPAATAHYSLWTPRTLSACFARSFHGLLFHKTGKHYTLWHTNMHDVVPSGRGSKPAIVRD